ncbi:MAG: hypothetical protein U0359_30010, partial [Byssovorax sp.]
VGGHTEKDSGSTTWRANSYGRAITDLDPMTDEGARLNVYRHRLVFVNARAPMEKLPPALRPLMGLLEDTLDGQVDETRYPDDVSQHILARILCSGMTPDENAKLKEEAGWEATKREERQSGRVEGEKIVREAIADLCDAYGLTLTADHEQHLASLDLAGLNELRVHLKKHRAWPARDGR